MIKVNGPKIQIEGDAARVLAEFGLVTEVLVINIGADDVREIFEYALEELGELEEEGET